MKGKNIFEENNQESLLKLSDGLVLKTRAILNNAKTEEDLKIGFEKLLDPIKQELKIKSNPKYERSIFEAGRTDALHGRVIIEYEAPRSFQSKKWLDHAYDQLVEYISDLSTSEKQELFLFEAKFVGVGFDGEQIFFVKYRGDKSKPKLKFDKKDFVPIGPYDFDSNSAKTFLTYLRSLNRLPLTAENLSQKFGPQSSVALKIVPAFIDALNNWNNEKIKVFFNEWQRLFGIVYGEQFNGQQESESSAIARLYGVDGETNFQKLLFCVHTYFAFLMKIIAAELLILKDAPISSSLSTELAHAADEELRNKLKDIENGGIYAKKGITNFLEGDFFSWYIEAFDSPRLKEEIRNVARTLSEFEPATSSLEPSITKDLLKKLYQYLVPQEVRHKLGEYYTPDWLAELLLNEVGYDGNNLKRFLDPACGSGTFLVLAIQRAKYWGYKNKRPAIEVAKCIKSNIWGFDLNPLAVIAARTNFLFALGDLASLLQNFEIPIYLTDSVLNPARNGGNLFSSLSVEIPTSVRTFDVPKIWLQEEFMMKDAAPIIERMVKAGYSPDEAMDQFKKNGLVFPPNEPQVKGFYKQILELENQKKDGIWARFLKNAFASTVAGKFDFVVGNPPWIRWDYLSKKYREATLPLWKNYGLFSLKGFQTMLGGGKKDFSMLFVYASADYYLKDSGKLGFLITQEVFKSKGAGEGFRRFQLGQKKFLKIIKALDFSSIQPFEGAVNKTAAIILSKGERTKYPVPYLVYNRKKGAGKILPEELFEKALMFLKRKNYLAKPIDSKFGSWQTQSKESRNLDKIEGNNFYKAILGANPNPYGVFWLEIKQVLSDGNIIIRNLVEHGKLEIVQVEETIEPDLVFPAIRGSDIKRWGYNQEIFLLMVQDPKKREPIIQDVMKKNYPRIYSYLTQFRDILLNRGSKTIRNLAHRTEFYAMFGIEEKTVSKFKTVWQAMSNDLYASVISSVKTQIGYKTGIPLHTTSFFATDNEAEAHYLCAIINSNPVRDFIKSFSSAGRGFGTPSIMQYVGIPKFDLKNPLHKKLSEISKKCHQLKLENKEKEIEKLEKQNDALVAQLFKIKN